jgi:large subunit ribosomal protein L6
MSRLAKKPLIVPTGTEFTINGNEVHIKGKKGHFNFTLDNEVKVEKLDNHIMVRPTQTRKRVHPMIGTTYRLLMNMIHGVNEGFEHKLQLVGVGYRAKTQGKGVELSVGFSNPKQIDLRAGATAETPTNTEINIKGINKQVVGQSAADIRRVRPPEPYKGKGIRKAGQQIRLKETKKK